MENPWNIQSLYELQYFICPSCIFKNQSKQELVNHAYECHPESIEYLMNLDDKSILDLKFPWIESNTENIDHQKVKIETKEENFEEYLNENTMQWNEPEIDITSKNEISESNFTKNSHEEIKAENPDLICGYCKKTFPKPWYVNRHVKAVHEGVKDYACDHCEMMFSQVRDLNRDKYFS